MPFYATINGNEIAGVTDINHITEVPLKEQTPTPKRLAHRPTLILHRRATNPSTLNLFALIADQNGHQVKFTMSVGVKDDNGDVLREWKVDEATISEWELIRTANDDDGIEKIVVRADSLEMVDGSNSTATFDRKALEDQV